MRSLIACRSSSARASLRAAFMMEPTPSLVGCALKTSCVVETTPTNCSSASAIQRWSANRHGSTALVASGLRTSTPRWRSLASASAMLTATLPHCAAAALRTQQFRV